MPDDLPLPPARAAALVESAHEADVLRAVGHLRAAKEVCRQEWLPADAILDAMLVVLAEEARDARGALVLASALERAARQLAAMAAPAGDATCH